MEDSFDFEKRILATAYNGNEENLDVEDQHFREIKDLELPKAIEEKLTSFVNRCRKTYSTENILFIGCPEKYLSHIANVLANELGVNIRFFDGRSFPKNKQESEVVRFLTFLNDRDVACFSHIESLQPESSYALEQYLLTEGVDITIGKGDSARKIRMDMASTNSVIAIDNISQLPTSELDAFYEIVDFKKYEHELRLMFISNFARKNKLVINQCVKEMLARQFTNDNLLTVQLVDIRSKAYSANINEITEAFLQESGEEIPGLEHQQ